MRKGMSKEVGNEEGNELHHCQVGSWQTILCPKIAPLV